MRKLFLIVSLVASTVSLVGVSASADHVEPSSTCLPFPWQSEAQLLTLPLVSPNGRDCWRPVIWPGTGHLLTRQQVYQHESFYGSQGYDRNFLWYAPQTTIRARDYEDRLWGGCDHIPTGVGQLCTSTNVSRLGDYVDTVNHDPTLTVLGWADDWIALACGNHLIRDGAPETPVPSIPIDKFIDENRNGVRDAGDVTTGPRVQGVQFEVWRTDSVDWVGQATGRLATLQTDQNGDAVFRLDGHGPGVYEIREIVPAGSIATTATVREVVVEPGIGDRRLPTQQFGNAPGEVDVEKVEFTISDIPDDLDVRTDTEIAVDVTIRNNGPADHVPVRDRVVATVPEDCTISNREQSIDVTLRRGESYSTTFVFVVNCDRPSEHQFTFDDVLQVLDARLTDTVPSNNTRSTSQTRPVWAETDLRTSTALFCPASTTVGTTIGCDLTVAVTNDGYGPLDATLDTDITQTFELDDCTTDPAFVRHEAFGLADGETRPFTQSVSVSCDHRSFHQITATTTVTADDPHVIDVDPTNDRSQAASDFEVFQDAGLEVTAIRPFCDEVVGTSSFTCSVAVDVVNDGPAPDVAAVVEVSISGYPDSTPCTFAPDATQQATRTLAVGEPVTVSWSWRVTCEPGSFLHPFRFVADVSPTADEPHAIDEPGPFSRIWKVPTCAPTVNPHGQRQPQAPGSGMNEDGFYVFGVLPADPDNQVYIRDTDSGTLFGPLPSGVRIKWVEANGATPRLTPMAGNRSSNNGQATAVDHQIRAQGDAAATYFDEDGNEISTVCLVPPFPK